MAILETLTITIGAAIAKSILGIWLKEHPVAWAVGTSVLDLIKEKTPNILAARQATRQFEALGDKVAASLEPVFDKYELREDSYEAVAHEVAAAIEAANISTKLLADLNYDPSRLTEHIRMGYPKATRDFSEVETNLYERTIDLSAQYIIDLAPNLPEYTSQNFTEILQRLDISLKKLDEILEDLNKLQETSEIVDAGVAHAYFERDYRASVIRKLDRVELLGVDVSRPTRRYQLEVSYVSLQVTDPETEEAGHMLVDEALGRATRTVIVGEAGSGKTTLLKWLAVQSAANKFDRAMTDWLGTVPFFVQLRRFPEGPPPPERFIEKVVPEIAHKMPELWVHDILRSGRALLLIDGLDEVPPAKREEVLNWVEDLVLLYPNTRIVLTSRPAAYYELSWWDLFQEFELEPMQIREIELFVSYWHKAVLQEQLLESKEKIRTIANKLLTTLKDTPSLLRLATNPLLCAMICALHYDRHMQLPKDRITLYEACCSMLLERRDIAREVRIAQYPELTYKEKRLLLDDLAYWMMKNDYSSVDRKQAVTRLRLHLENLRPQVTESDVDILLTMFVERSGVVREATADAIDFVHRTFQEYMAASAATREGDWGLLTRRASDDLWQETIVLAAGFANKEQANNLISDLLCLAEESSARKSRYELLAISCLETIVELSPNIRSTVQGRLDALIPPKSRDEWKALAAAGDLCIPFLEYSDKYSEEEAVACLQVLGMIRTLPALDKLGPYTHDKRRKVNEAIESVLSYLTPEEVSESGLSEDLLRSLARHVDGDSMRLSGTLLYAISEVPQERLQGVLPSTILDLNLIDHRASAPVLSRLLPNLRSITVTGDPVSELDSLIGLAHLIKLDLRNKGVEWPGFQSLRSLRLLKHLRIATYTESWPDFSELDVFPDLRYLSLFCQWSTDLPELEDFASHVNLEYIHLATKVLLGGWPDLEPLSYLSDLKAVELSTESNEIPDMLYGIAELEGIERLTINVGRMPAELSALQEQFEVFLPHAQVVINEGWSSNLWDCYEIDLSCE